MTRRAILIVIAIALVVGIYEVERRRAHFKSSGPPSLIHSVAPDFSLHDLNNQPLDLANYRGKVVVLNFWATWCTPCRGEIPHFVKLQDEYREPGLQVIGISMDDDAKPVLNFYQQFKMNYPVALGNEKIAEAYGGILGLPITFLIGRDGRVRTKYIGEVNMSTLEQEIKTLLQEK